MKIARKLFFPCMFLIAMSGCIFEDESDDKKDETKSREPVIGAVYVGDEAYKAIGCGYDIFGNYADPTQIKGRVIEAYNLPDEWTKRTPVNHSIFSTEYGKTIREYQSKMQLGVEVSGEYMAFSGAVKTNFSSDYYSYTNTSFATVMGKINKYQITIEPNYARVNMLRPYMANQASKDLNDSTIDPEHIFMWYGTHVITGAMMGARLDFSVTMRTSEIITGRSLDVYAEAEYSSLFSKVNTTSRFNSEEERKQYEEKRKRVINAIGGDSEQALEILTNDDYNKWISSISGNEVFCDYTEKGLIPIWLFCDSLERQNEIADHYKSWAENRQIVAQDAVPAPEDCILDIQVKNSDNGYSYNANGLNYIKIDQDLNEGAGGNFIYIYAAIGKDNSTNPYPIKSIAILRGTSDQIRNHCPQGYSYIDSDLNEGAGGEFAYLCISREVGHSPIRRLEVWNKTDKKFYHSFGASQTGSYYDVDLMVYIWWKGATIKDSGQMPYDLNKGAGGDYIYLLYSRDND